MAPKKKQLLKENIKKVTKENEQPSLKKGTKDLSRHLTREDIQKANKHKKWCSTSYVMKKYKLKWDTATHLSEWPKSRIQKPPNPD